MKRTDKHVKETAKPAQPVARKTPAQEAEQLLASLPSPVRKELLHNQPVVTADAPVHVETLSVTGHIFVDRTGTYDLDKLRAKLESILKRDPQLWDPYCDRARQEAAQERKRDRTAHHLPQKRRGRRVDPRRAEYAARIDAGGEHYTNIVRDELQAEPSEGDATSRDPDDMKERIRQAVKRERRSKET